jgi:hypothetical protein
LSGDTDITHAQVDLDAPARVTARREHLDGQSDYNQRRAMPEDTPSPPPAPIAPPPTPSQPGIPFNIGEEFGTAKRNLPPVKIVLIGAAIIALIAGLIAFVQRPQSAATGSIDDVVSVEVPNQNLTMVAINVSLQNNGKKPFLIRTIKSDLDSGSGTFSNDAASPVDFDRYFQAFPTLKQHALNPLEREAQIDPGARTEGTIIVAFPVTPDAFINRKSLKVTIQAYYQPVPLVLTK